MKSIVNFWNNIVSIGICLLICTSIHPTLFVQGNGPMAPFTFTSVINTAAFDQANGALYAGLATNSSSPSFVISKAARFFDTPSFTGIAPSGFQGTGIAFLALATSNGVPATIMTAAQTQTTTLGANSVFAFPIDNSTSAVSTQLLDAGNTFNANGSLTAGTAALAANEEYIFTPVAANGAPAFGTTNSGIAVVSLDFSISFTGGLSGLTQTAAVPGDQGIKAQRFDASTTAGAPSVPQIFINHTGSIATTPSVYWDDILQRLYIADTITSGTTAADGARSITVGRIDDPGELTLLDSVPNSAITSTNTSANQNEIIAGIHSNAGTSFVLTVSAVRVMHPSTGPSYLIVNGGNGVNAGNLLFALPLVDNRDEDGDITDEATQGTFADKNSSLGLNGHYVTPATDPGDLVQYPSTAAVDIAALVGGAPMPIQSIQNPSDIVVTDDTVYVTFNIPQNSNNDAGILYSQAQFDATGKIVGWTPWSQRAFPFLGLPGTMNPERIFLFAVDAITGNVWALGGDADQTVAVTQWDRGSNPLALTTQLNLALPQGSYSVLDLDAFTRGFSGSTASRYALFGGTNRVMFAKISQNYPANGTATMLAAGQTAPQMVIDDFTMPENFLGTSLPAPGGNVTSLEYARTTAPSTQYFFAGTETGLFVFANIDGSGLTVSDFSDLDAAPFTTGTWTKAANIPGSITAIKTLGNTLYVLTSTTSKLRPFSSTLYSIPFTTSLSTMFSTSNIATVAQTGTDTFSNVLSFNGMQLVATNATGSSEQMLLATNQGLFRSQAPAGLQGATTQSAAAWALVQPNDTTTYSGIAAPNPSVVNVTTPVAYTTGTSSTTWPISVQNGRGKNTFGLSNISQVSGNTNTGSFTFHPTHFNGNGFPTHFATLPSTTQFFSDGARRFFIIRQPNDAPHINHLMLAPYDDVSWAITNPAQNVLSNPTFSMAQSFFWVRQIGASGIVMAGTHNGVVALE